MMVSKIIMPPLLWIFKRQKQMFFRGQVYFSLRGQQTWEFPGTNQSTITTNSGTSSRSFRRQLRQLQRCNDDAWILRYYF